MPNCTNRFIEGSTVGTYIEAGLPNIKNTNHMPYVLSGNNNDPKDNGQALYIRDTVANCAVPSGNHYSCSFSFDASRANSIYGNSTTVQPPAICMNFIIKY